MKRNDWQHRLPVPTQSASGKPGGIQLGTEPRAVPNCGGLRRVRLRARAPRGPRSHALAGTPVHRDAPTVRPLPVAAGLNLCLHRIKEPR